MRNNLLDVPSNRYTQGSSWNSLKEHESWPSAWTIHLKFTRSAEEGDGFLISYPDFSDCLSDGETVEEALTNGKDALKATIAALKAKELFIPAPNSCGVASGKFVARVPKTVHARLTTRAKAEGVSLNTLVLTFIAEGLGRKERRA